ncbi:integrase core domain-containing protein [Comamonas thiooxydans]|nr:integrase core domain-containing protein [Comamonas thiooxydans]
MSGSRQPTGEHEFDQLCQALEIEHRLTRPKTPQINGMIERFNGRLSHVLRSPHFNSGKRSKKWRMKVPDLFVKNVRNHPGPDG